MALRLKANRRFPSIPVVVDDAKNHTQVLMAMKEALDIGQRRTGDLFNSFVRVEDLIDLGLITIEGNTNAIVGADLSEIANIGDLSGSAEGDFLRFRSGEWVNDDLFSTDITQVMVTQHQAALSIAWSQLTGTPPSLDDLFDVDAPSPDEGDVLTFESGEWVASPSSGGVDLLADLNDVEIYAPSDGDVLTFDGYFWTNQPPALGGGTIVYADASSPVANIVSNTTTETQFDSSYVFPASQLDVGLIIRGELRGVYSTDASAGTLRIRVKFAGTTILDTTAFTAANSVVNKGWKLDFTAIIVLDSATGQIEAQGLASFSTSASDGVLVDLENTAAITANTTANSELSVTAQWGTADSDNSIRLRTMLLFAESVDFIPPDTTVSLLHFEGTDGSTVMNDQYGKAWVAEGNAQIDTAQFKFGASALKGDGTGDEIEVTHSDFVFGTSDFTIECFVRYDTRSGNNFAFIWAAGWGAYTFSSQWAVFNGVASNVILGGTVADDTWYHVAVCRNGTNLRLFINGVQTGATATDSTNHTSGTMRIGTQTNGWVDEFRVTREALYTANFTPPSGPFPDP